MPLSISPLTTKHEAEIARAAQRALKQWAGAADVSNPDAVVKVLERVLLFLRQNGSPTKQADHVTSLAFCFGEQVVKGAGWRWMNVTDDGGLNPGLVSPDGRFACLPLDAITERVMAAGRGSLGALYSRLAHSTPEAGAEIVALP